MKTEKEILIDSLKAISNYVQNYRPAKASELRAQLSLIREIAIGALDEAQYIATQPT